jgi:hypothetical protein
MKNHRQIPPIANRDNNFLPDIRDGWYLLKRLNTDYYQRASY